jgi:hypothetical protein
MASVLPAENPQPQTGNRSLKWKKGGKKAGKTAFRKNNDKEKQYDELAEKIAGINPASLAGPFPSRSGNSKLHALLADCEPKPGDKLLSELLSKQSLGG